MRDIGRCHAGANMYLHWVTNLLSSLSCSLDENYIDEQGAVVLAKVLPECKALVSLR